MDIEKIDYLRKRESIERFEEDTKSSIKNPLLLEQSGNKTVF